MDCSEKIRRETLEWHKGFLKYLDELGGRLIKLKTTDLVSSVSLLQVALDFTLENGRIYKEEGFRILPGSRLYRNGRAGVVFCAASIESTVSTALVVRFMDTKPRVQRQLLMDSVVRWNNLDILRAFRKFYPDMNIFDHPILQEILTTRNSILHARPDYSEDYVAHVATAGPPRTITKWTRRLLLPARENSIWVTELPRYVDFTVELFEQINARIAHPGMRGLPKMRKDHPILKMRQYEAEIRGKKIVTGMANRVRGGN
jgi:hypothetical protein